MMHALGCYRERPRTRKAHHAVSNSNKKKFLLHPMLVSRSLLRHGQHSLPQLRQQCGTSAPYRVGLQGGDDAVLRRLERRRYL
jgi:hypothetical protein